MAITNAGIVSEHEALAQRAETQGEENTATKSLHKQIMEWLGRAKKARSEIDYKWDENWQFYIGNQWKERPSWRFSKAVNVTRANIETQVPILTDARPEVEFEPTEVSDTVWAETLTDIQKANWQKYNWDEVITENLYDSQLFSAGFGICEWDASLESGAGDLRFDSLDPYYCFPDPFAPDINHPRSRYFIYAEPVPTSWLKARYPGKKDKIKSDINTLGLESISTEAIERIYTDTDRPMRTRSNRDVEPLGGEPLTMFIRCWFKDNALETEETMNEDGTKMVQRIKKKFPRGRFVEMTSTTILFDGHNGALLGLGSPQVTSEPYRDGRFPVEHLTNYNIPRQLYGLDEIDPYKGIQETVNWLFSTIIDHLRYSSNPQWIISNDSGLEPEDINNRAGTVIKTADPNGVRREAGEALPPGLVQMFEVVLDVHDRLTGIQDVTRGAAPPSITSALQLEGVTEAAQTRLRLKQRNIDRYLRNIGKLMLSRMLQFYTAPRVARITNREGFPEFVQFFINETPDGRREMNVSRAQVGPNGQVVAVKQQSMEMKGVPDVKVESGTALPFARAQKAATAKELFSAGAITLESLLKAIQWPNPEDEARKVTEQQQAAAQAAAQGVPPQ